MNQSGRMDKTREALRLLQESGYANSRAALAEVEEWETRANSDYALALLLRAEAAEAQVVSMTQSVQVIQNDRARLEAEADRLREALPALRELFVDLRGDWSDNRGPCREGIALIDALVPADRNTT